MTPSWLEAHASYINTFCSSLSTTEQLTFNTGSLDYAVLLKVPIIPADILEDSSLIILKIVVSLDRDIGKNGHSDLKFGVSDGVSFVGFESVDKPTYVRDYAPCFGIEGISGNRLTGRREISPTSPTPNDSFYPGVTVICVSP